MAHYQNDARLPGPIGEAGKEHLQYLLTAYLFGNISAAGRREVEEHLAGCATCRTALEELRRTLALVEEAVEADRREYVFEERRRARVLVAAKNARHDWLGRLSPFAVPRFSWRLGAVAAVLLVVLVGGLFLSLVGGKSAPREAFSRDRLRPTAKPAERPGGHRYVVRGESLKAEPGAVEWSAPSVGEAPPPPPTHAGTAVAPLAGRELVTEVIRKRVDEAKPAAPESKSEVAKLPVGAADEARTAGITLRKSVQVDVQRLEPAKAEKPATPAAETRPSDPTSTVASGVVVPKDILARAELGDHWETVNPDRPETRSAFGNPDAHFFADKEAGAGMAQGRDNAREAALEEAVAAGGGGTPGTGGGYGGGTGRGVAARAKRQPTSTPATPAPTAKPEATAEAQEDDAASKINVNSADNLAVVLDKLTEAIGKPLEVPDVKKENAPVRHPAAAPRDPLNRYGPNQAEEKLSPYQDPGKTGKEKLVDLEVSVNELRDKKLKQQEGDVLKVADGKTSSAAKPFRWQFTGEKERQAAGKGKVTVGGLVQVWKDTTVGQGDANHEGEGPKGPGLSGNDATMKSLAREGEKDSFLAAFQGDTDTTKNGREQAKMQTSTRHELEIYDVRDLTTVINDFPAPRMEIPGVETKAPPPAPKNDLMQRLRERLSAADFADAQASIEEQGGKLVVMNRPEVQGKIKKALEDFRREQAAKPDGEQKAGGLASSGHIPYGDLLVYPSSWDKINRGTAREPEGKQAGARPVYDLSDLRPVLRGVTKDMPGPELESSRQTNAKDPTRATATDPDALTYPFTWQEIAKRTDRRPIAKKEEEPWKSNLRKKLQRRVNFEFVDTPLPEAVAYLHKLTGVTIVVDPKVLEGKPPTINLRVADMTLELALGWVSRLAELDYALKDKAVFVTKKTNITEDVELRIYDVTDLPANAASIAQKIRKVVVPDSWDPAMGASLEERSGKLVVIQRPGVHEQIDRLLNGVRAERSACVFAPYETALRAFRYFRAENGKLAYPEFVRRPLPVPAPELTDEGMDEDAFIERYGYRPFVDAARDHLSTFGMDVDTASYTQARAALREGRLPEPESVRTEEFVNYFKQPYEVAGDETFGVYAEGMPSPFGCAAGLDLVKIGIKSRAPRPDERKPAALTFAVDLSGSMGREDAHGLSRLDLLREALRGMVASLAPEDSVCIVGFNEQAQVVLPRTEARFASRILDALNRLGAGGGTNLEAGLALGYRLADEAFSPEAVNRVVLCSDGVANVGQQGPEELLKLVQIFAARGIDLAAVGLGLGQYNDPMMAKLADSGNGSAHFVGTPQEAEKVFREQLPPHLDALARDAKVQVDFDPAVVARYRLLGYEKRKIADKDFRNDKIDAGEVGHATLVTALYEIERRPNANGPLGRIYLRWKDASRRHLPVVERNYPLGEGLIAARAETASADLRFLACVAQFAELLRGSPWARTGSFAGVLGQLERLSDECRSRAEWHEVTELVRRAQGLSVQHWAEEARTQDKK